MEWAWLIPIAIVVIAGLLVAITHFDQGDE